MTTMEKPRALPRAKLIHPDELQCIGGPMCGAKVARDKLVLGRFRDRIEPRPVFVGGAPIEVNHWGPGERRVEYVEFGGQLHFNCYL